MFIWHSVCACPQSGVSSVVRRCLCLSYLILVNYCIKLGCKFFHLKSFHILLVWTFYIILYGKVFSNCWNTYGSGIIAYTHFIWTFETKFGWNSCNGLSGEYLKQSKLLLNYSQPYYMRFYRCWRPYNCLYSLYLNFVE